MNEYRTFKAGERLKPDQIVEIKDDGKAYAVTSGLTQQDYDDAMDDQNKMAVAMFEDSITWFVKEVAKWILFGSASLTFGIGISVVLIKLFT